MNVFEAIFGRRSVRSFKKEEIDDRLIGLMLYCATQAPSAGNTQDWVFIVVKNEEIKRKLAKAALDQDFIVEAPVVVVVCSDLKKISLRYEERGERLYSIQDVAAATQNMLLAAYALGLSSCWVGAFDEEEVKFILELPEHIRPLAIIPVGYSEEKPEAPPRIPFENLTYLDRFGGKYQIEFKPLETYLREALKKLKTVEKKPTKKISFEEFIKRLVK
ncbi:MAG: nitroreductase family protein [Candidatus Aenigmatarchaeota archaeon]